MFEFLFRKKLSGPALVPSVPQLDRDAELLENLRALQAELRAFDNEALRLRTKYDLKINAIGQVIGMRCELAEGEKVRAEWRALGNRIAPRLKLFHDVQHEIAERKLAKNLEAA